MKTQNATSPDPKRQLSPVVGFLFGCLLACPGEIQATEDPPGCSFANGGLGNLSQASINFSVPQAHLGDAVPVYPSLGMVDKACRAINSTGVVWIATGRLTNFLETVTLDPGVLVTCPAASLCRPGPYNVLITPGLVGAGVLSPCLSLSGAPKIVRAVLCGDGTVQTEPSTPLTELATASISIVSPCIQVVAQPTYPPGTNCFGSGAPVEFSGYVTNCGDIMLTNVTVAASRSLLGGGLFDTNGFPLVQPLTVNFGQAVRFRGSFTALPAENCTGTAANLLTVRGTDITTIGGLRASVTNQTTVLCNLCGGSQFTLNPPSTNFGAGAQSGSFAVTGTCSWSATPNQPWIHTSSTGTNNGIVNYTVDANPGSGSRSGNIVVGSQSFGITQTGTACGYSLNPIIGSHSAAAESGSFDVTAPPGCPWGATPNQTWIHTSSTGNGNGTVNYTVDGNCDSASRSGTIIVGGQVFNLNQAGAAAPDTVPPTATFLSLTNGAALAGQVALVARLTDNVNLARVEFRYFDNSRQTYVAVGTNNLSGTLVTNSVMLNSTAISNGEIALLCQVYDACGNQGFASLQVHVGNCSGPPALIPISADFPSGPQSDSVYVQVDPVGCSWTAIPDQPWIQTTNSSGNGSGRVYFTLDANSSTNSRSGIIAVNGQSFPISQAGFGTVPGPFLNSVVVSNGLFRFLLHGSVGSLYVIQVSSNVVNWIPLATNSIPANGSVLVTDPVGSAVRRFYRAVEQR